MTINGRAERLTWAEGAAATSSSLQSRRDGLRFSPIDAMDDDGTKQWLADGDRVRNLRIYEALRDGATVHVRMEIKIQRGQVAFIRVTADHEIRKPTDAEIA